MPRDKSKAAPTASRRPPPAARRRGAPRAVAVIVALVGAGIAAWALVSRAPRAPAPAIAPSATPTALPYDQLVALAERVKALLAEKRYGESLPGSRALLAQQELYGRLVAPMLVDYGRTLNNAAFEGGDHAPRSSVERIAFEREALASARAALAIAKQPRDRAEAITLVGLVHEAWGFPYDAYLTYRAAMQTDPTYPVAREHYDQFVARLEPAGAARRR